jgi:hypothetical protein
MPTPKQRSRGRVPKPDRRALELLAASPDGCTETILLAHDFTIAQIFGQKLVHKRDSLTGVVKP